MGCHEMSWSGAKSAFPGGLKGPALSSRLRLSRRRRKASCREERARVGSRKGMGAAPSFRLASGADTGAGCRQSAPDRSDPLSRAFACGRGRVSAPARFAHLIARARGRHRTHLACRLNRGRSAPGRRGREAAPDATSLAPIIAQVLPLLIQIREILPTNHEHIVAAMPCRWAHLPRYAAGAATWDERTEGRAVGVQSFSGPSSESRACTVRCNSGRSCLACVHTRSGSTLS